MGCNIRNVIVTDITNTGNEILISYKDKSGLTDMTFKRSKESFLMNFGRGEAVSLFRAEKESWYTVNENSGERYAPHIIFF